MACGSSSTAPHGGLSILDIVPDLVAVDHILLCLPIQDLGHLAWACRVMNDLLNGAGEETKHVWKLISGVQERSRFGPGSRAYVGALGRSMLTGESTRSWKERVLLTEQRLLTGGLDRAASALAARRAPGDDGDDLAARPRNSRVGAALGFLRRASPKGAAEAAEAAGTASPSQQAHKIRIREELLQQGGLGNADGPAALFFAGHAGHVHWLEGTRVLAFAGSFFRDQVGGGTPYPLPYVYELDVGSIPVRIERTICYARAPDGAAASPWPHGEPHPQIMGAASAPHDRRVIFFGGGSPIDRTRINNHVTEWSLVERRWTGLWRPALPDARSAAEGEPNVHFPRPRQGIRGTVYDGRFYFFGGREFYEAERPGQRTQQGHRGDQDSHDDSEEMRRHWKGCKNDLWSFDLELRRWRKERTCGQSPAPRVWYQACEASHGRWLITGGSLWEFEYPPGGEDSEEVRRYQHIFCLHFDTLTWEQVATDTGTAALPPWRTAGCLVATGRELLLFGGCRPQEVGAAGITRQALGDEHPLRGWKKWYNDLAGQAGLEATHAGRRGAAAAGTTEAYVFDSKYAKWHKQLDLFEVSCGKDLRRSHFDACFVPTVKRIFVFGGSRYFTGEYFHDIITLDLPDAGAPPPAAAPAAGDPNQGSLVFPGRRWYQLRGQLGRIRGMVATGEVTRLQYARILEEVEQEDGQDDVTDGEGTPR